MINCLAIIGVLCLHSAEAVQFDNGALARGFSIKGEGYDVEVKSGGDFILTPQWKKFATACAQRQCLAYYKYCSADAGRGRCNFVFGHVGDETGTELTILADAPSAMARAQGSIGIIVGPELMAAEISLADMSIDSHDPSFPVCPTHDPVSAC